MKKLLKHQPRPAIDQNFKTKSYNGYQWYAFESGLHFFSKHVEAKGYAVLCCEEKQVFNGDLEFMSMHGLTLDKARQSAVRKGICQLLTRYFNDEKAIKRTKIIEAA